MSQNIIQDQFFIWVKVIRKPIDFFSSPGRPPKKTNFTLDEIEMGWSEVDPSNPHLPPGSAAKADPGANIEIQCSPVFQSQVKAARWLRDDPDGQDWYANALTCSLFAHRRISAMN